MPAKSKAPQRYMAIAEHQPSALRGPRPAMTRPQLKAFAATPTKALPAHVGHPHKNLGTYLHPKKARMK